MTWAVAVTSFLAGLSWIVFAHFHGDRAKAAGWLCLPNFYVSIVHAWFELYNIDIHIRSEFAKSGSLGMFVTYTICLLYFSYLRWKRRDK